MPESQPFVSCEDALPPILGVRNFFATLTSIPLLVVPLNCLWCAVQLEAAQRRAPALHVALVTWLITLTALFCTNLAQHAVGGDWAKHHEVMAAVQAVWNSCQLNALRRRSGYHSINEHLGIALAMLACVMLVTIESLAVGSHEPACAVVQAVTAPFIIGTMGSFSWQDARAWWLFKRSCMGLALVGVMCGPHGLERQMCRLDVGVAYHAIVDHACIWCLFGGVGKNAVHLVDLSTTRRIQ